MRHHHRHHGAAFAGAAPPMRPNQAAAFAEGRRMREEARMRRQSMRMRGRPQRTGVHPLVVLFLMPGVLVILAGIGAGLIGLAAAAAAVASLMPLVLLVTGVIAINRQQRRRALRRGGSAGTAPLPARPAARPRPDLVWVAARQRFYTLRAEYAAFECDAMQVLRLPALADVAVPSTARFVDAFAEAQALETDSYPQNPHGAQFVAAADRAERAWRAARDAAERIRLSGLSPAERSAVERIVKLLTTARDSDSEPERLAAYARARSELAKLDRAGVIHLPRTAQAALDATAQGALPPARETA